MEARSRRHDRCAWGRWRRARPGRTGWCAWLKPRGSRRLLTVINRLVPGSAVQDRAALDSAVQARAVMAGGLRRGHQVPGVLAAEDGQEERAQDHPPAP